MNRVNSRNALVMMTALNIGIGITVIMVGRLVTARAKDHCFTNDFFNFFSFSFSDIVQQESLAVADKPARRESMPKIPPSRRENKPSGGTPSNINEIYTSMKSSPTFSGLQFCRWQYGSTSIRLAVVASQICEIPRNSAKIGTYSNSRSSTVMISVSIESACATSYKSLMVTSDVTIIYK